MVFKFKVLHFKSKNTPIKETNRKRKFKCSLSFFGQTRIVCYEIVFRGIHGVALMACPKLTKAAKLLKKPQVHSILYVQGKHVFKTDFCIIIYKGFMDVFYILTWA